MRCSALCRNTAPNRQLPHSRKFCAACARTARWSIEGDFARDPSPRDIVQLETGNVIPADLRLLEAVNLRIQEAALTGESEAIGKHTAALSNDELPLGDRRNMAYMGNHRHTKGRGLLVIATGMNTELGKIADMIQAAQQEQTPLQRRLDALGKTCPRWHWHRRTHFPTRHFAR